MDDSLDEYINQFMDNSPSYLDLPMPNISIKDNLGDKYNHIDYRSLSKCQQVTYIVDAVYKAGFPSLADAIIAQIHNFIYVQDDGLFIICLAI